MKQFFLFVFLFLGVHFSAFSAPTVSLNLDSIKILDLTKVVYGDLLKESYVFGSDFLKLDDVVTVNLSDKTPVSIRLYVDSLIHQHGFNISDTSGVFYFEKTPAVQEQIFVYVPRFRSASYLSDVLFKVADIKPLAARNFSPVSATDILTPGAKQVETPGAASQQIDRSALDQLAYNCLPERCDYLRFTLSLLDTKEPQVMIKAAVYEVGLTKGQGSALQLAGSLLNGHIKASIGSLIPASASLSLFAGGLEAAISLLDADSRFKTISKPMLMVRTGADAKFAVGQQVPVLGSVSQDRNGSPVQSIDYRQSGIILNIRPDVRADIVQLVVSQEISNFVATTTGVSNSPTLQQRSASTDLLLKSGDVAVFAGLEEQKDDDTNSRFFGFLIGKSKNFTTSQILVLIEAQAI